tara:strand:+ start:1513 stop:1881 length:369 start_codon:yes stop_codon:yes gene_type:complete
MKYTVYTTSTGEVISIGSSNVTNVSDIGLASGQTAVEGTYPPGQYKFVDGSPVAFTPDFWPKVRRDRNTLLTESDWTQTVDSPLSSSKKTEWATYRQALRDVPANNSSKTSFDNVVWPTEPS